MGVDIRARMSSGSMEGECVGRKKAGSIGGGNSRGIIHKNEGGVRGVQ